MSPVSGTGGTLPAEGKLAAEDALSAAACWAATVSLVGSLGVVPVTASETVDGFVHSGAAEQEATTSASAAIAHGAVLRAARLRADSARQKLKLLIKLTLVDLCAWEVSAQ